MKVLVTSGGTREHIDDVRVLTNVSSGKLGALIATELLDSGFEVEFVTTPQSVLPEDITLSDPSINVTYVNGVDEG